MLEYPIQDHTDILVFHSAWFEYFSGFYYIHAHRPQRHIVSCATELKCIGKPV